jgi:hypothetical protein
MRSTPLLGKVSGIPLTLQSAANKNITSVMRAVDKGRYLHFVFYFDDLADFSSGGLGGRNPDPEGLGDEISKAIDWAHKEASKQLDFRDGISLVVFCGIGRVTEVAMPRTERPSWHHEIILAAPDLVTLSWLSEMSPLLLWRLAEAEAALSGLNVSLQNANGLLNLVARVHAQDGHLVPHNAMPGRDRRRRCSNFHHDRAERFAACAPSGACALGRAKCAERAGRLGQGPETGGGTVRGRYAQAALCHRGCERGRPLVGVPSRAAFVVGRDQTASAAGRPRCSATTASTAWKACASTPSSRQSLPAGRPASASAPSSISGRERKPERLNDGLDHF